VTEKVRPGQLTHAAVVIVVDGDKRPVCDYTYDADCAAIASSRSGNEVFDAGGVEELDVGHG
jgi:hypothetical protein